MKSSVALVLDRYFGNRVEELARRMPVWVILSADNRQGVAVARSRLKDAANITEFLSLDGEDLGSMCARDLEIEETGSVPGALCFKKQARQKTAT